MDVRYIVRVNTFHNLFFTWNVRGRKFSTIFCIGIIPIRKKCVYLFNRMASCLVQVKVQTLKSHVK